MATRKIDSLTKPNQHDDLVERHASARLAQVEREKARTYQKNPRRILVWPADHGCDSLDYAGTDAAGIISISDKSRYRGHLRNGFSDSTAAAASS